LVQLQIDWGEPVLDGWQCWQISVFTGHCSNQDL
jgi:hypothetical protein